MEQLGVGDNTSRRARIYLKETEEINYCVGKHKGALTRYWFLYNILKYLIRNLSYDIRLITKNEKKISKNT